jgi:hypothetical protein
VTDQTLKPGSLLTTAPQKVLSPPFPRPASCVLQHPACSFQNWGQVRGNLRPLEQGFLGFLEGAAVEFALGFALARQVLYHLSQAFSHPHPSHP